MKYEARVSLLYITFPLHDVRHIDPLDYTTEMNLNMYVHVYVFSCIHWHVYIARIVYPT